MVELVDTQDLKSCAFGCAGSSPAPGILIYKTYLIGNTEKVFGYRNEKIVGGFFLERCNFEWD